MSRFCLRVILRKTSILKWFLLLNTLRATHLRSSLSDFEDFLKDHHLEKDKEFIVRIHTDVDLDSISSVYSESSDEEKDTSRRGHVSCDQYFCTYLMFLLCLPAGILAHRQIRRIRAVRVTLYAQPRRFKFVTNFEVTC